MGQHWIDTINSWPWSTIAAFMAVGVTLFVANSQSRQRRRQLGQEAMLDVNTAYSEWGAAVGEFLAYARHYTATRGGIPIPWSLDRLDPLTDATTKMDRAVKGAQMLCKNVQMQAQLTETSQILQSFLQLISGPYPDDPDENQQRIADLPSAGLAFVKDFNETTEALLARGFKKYGFCWGPIIRIRRRFAQRRAVAQSKLKGTCSGDSRTSP